MGNTCYVVATVTAADWRMTVEFRALLMTPSVVVLLTRALSLIPRDPRSRFHPVPPPHTPNPTVVSAVLRFRAPRRDARRLRPAQIIYGISIFALRFRSPRTRDADRARYYFAAISRQDRSRRAHLALVNNLTRANSALSRMEKVTREVTVRVIRFIVKYVISRVSIRVQ